jgi:hypothetical protein
VLFHLLIEFLVPVVIRFYRHRFFIGVQADTKVTPSTLVVTVSRDTHQLEK